MENEVRLGSPAGFLLIAMILLGIAAELFLNINEDPGTFIIFTLIFAAPGVFLLIAGAVALGIEAARQS
ncbi:hypothetical protein [Nocardioides phosphati]|uniref:hypothetical protein n=1 Tax=Nocardioides phosphati TaxID=1867775 RepID=UPI00166B9673|nr:hypothetical protein [Nocardioides phosphati]